MIFGPIELLFGIVTTLMEIPFLINLGLIIAVVVLARRLSEVKRRLDRLEGRPHASSPESFATGPASGFTVLPAKPLPVAQPENPSLEAKASGIPDLTPDRTPAPLREDATGKGLAIVGVIALLFGVGFFLKYAFDHDLITEAGRVIIGLIAGGALLGLGDFLSRREKYKEYSFFISGGGLAILYFSIYAAFGYYQLIGQPLAFTGMVLVTALGAAAAVNARSIYLAGLALSGGFLAPYIVSAGVNNQSALFGYILILDLGFLALSYFKRWLSLYPIVFIGTYGLFFSWVASFYSRAQFWPTIIFLTAYFLIFLLAPFLRSLMRQAKTGAEELLFVHANTAIYFLTAYVMLGDAYSAARGAFFAAGAVLMLGLGAALRSRNREDGLGAGAFLGSGLVLATLVIPIELESVWLVMAWAFEAFVLAVIGCVFRSSLTRTFAHVLALVTTLWLVVGNSFSEMPTGALLFWNERAYAYAVTIACLFGIGYVVRRFADRVSADDLSLRSAYFIGPVLLAVLWAYLEVDAFNAGGEWVTLSWIFGALVLCAGGFLLRSPGARTTGLVLYVFTWVKLLVADQFRWEGATPLANPRFGIFLLAIGLSYALAYLYAARRSEIIEDERWLSAACGVAANLLTVWALSLEVVSYFSTQPPSASVANQMNLSLSLLWGIYSGALMAIGILGKFRAIRVLGLCGLALVVLKVFLYDSAQLSDLYRIASFITLGIILLVTSFLFYRYREQIKEFILA